MFVDEAYALVRSSDDDFGQSAVDTLIKEMEDKRDEVVVILAGYEHNMERFFNSNPGFKSRVPLKYIFPDYTCNELVSVHKLFVDGTKLKWDGTHSEAIGNLKSLIKVTTGCCDPREANCYPNPNSGNARSVRNIFEAVVQKFALRIAGSDEEVDNLPEEKKKLSNSDVVDVIEDEVRGLATSVCDGKLKDINEKASQDMPISNAFVGSKQHAVEEFRRSIRLIISTHEHFKEFPLLTTTLTNCMTSLSTAAKTIHTSLESLCGSDGMVQHQIDILEGTTVPSEVTFIQQFDDAVSKLTRAGKEINLLADLVNEQLSKETVPEPSAADVLKKIYDASQVCKGKIKDLKEKTVMAPVASMMKFEDSVKEI